VGNRNIDFKEIGKRNAIKTSFDGRNHQPAIVSLLVVKNCQSPVQKGYPNLNWHSGLRFPATPDQIQQWLNQ
jgi:hypothetical protein